MLQKPDRRQLTWLVGGLIGFGAVCFALWLVAGYAGPTAGVTNDYQQVTATVVNSASCTSGAGASDTVSFTLGGHKHQGKLSGCGNAAGTQVTVLAPADFTDGGMVNLASTAPGNAAGLTHRVSFLLLLVAAGSGGASAYFFSKRPRRPSAARPRRPGRAVAKPFARKVAQPVGGPLTSASGRLPSLDPNEVTQTSEVNWFEDSGTQLPVDLSEHADRPSS